MPYELWDHGTGNQVGAYASVDAALDTVRRAIQQYGETCADVLTLAREDRLGRTTVLAMGSALADLALGRQQGGTGRYPRRTTSRP